MSTVARLIIALFVGPGVGALTGQQLAHTLGERLHLRAGDIARAEMSGLLAGVLAGFVFLWLAVRCVVGFGGRLRARLADPALLPTGILVALVLVAGQQDAPASLLVALRWTTIAAWMVGLLLLSLSLAYRPKPTVPEFQPERPEAAEPAPSTVSKSLDEQTWARYVSEGNRDE